MEEADWSGVVGGPEERVFFSWVLNEGSESEFQMARGGGSDGGEEVCISGAEPVCGGVVMEEISYQVMRVQGCLGL